MHRWQHSLSLSMVAHTRGSDTGGPNLRPELPLQAPQQHRRTLHGAASPVFNAFHVLATNAQTMHPPVGWVDTTCAARTYLLTQKAGLCHHVTAFGLQKHPFEQTARFLGLLRVARIPGQLQAVFPCIESTPHKHKGLCCGLPGGCRGAAGPAPWQHRAGQHRGHGSSAAGMQGARSQQRGCRRHC